MLRLFRFLSCGWLVWVVRLAGWGVLACLPLAFVSPAFAGGVFRVCWFVLLGCAALAGLLRLVRCVLFWRPSPPSLPWVPWRLARGWFWCAALPSSPGLRSAAAVAPALVVRVGRCRGLVLAVWAFVPLGFEGDEANRSCEGNGGYRRRCPRRFGENHKKGVRIMYYVPQIIRDRAKARREREAARRLNEDAIQSWVKFPDWLLYTHGIVDWEQLKGFALRELYLDYELECLKNGMEYDHPKIYGLKSSIMK